MSDEERASQLNSQLRAGGSLDEVLGERLFDKDWAEAIVKLSSITDRPADLVQWLSWQVRKRNDWRRALLVKRCWEKSAAAEDAAAQAAVVEALLLALVTGIRDEKGIRFSGVDPYVRRMAIRALAGMGPALAERLISLLDDERGIGAGAAEALGMIGDAKAVEPLISALADESREDVRTSAAKALANIGDRQAVAPLLAALADEDEDLRWAAAYALGKVGYPDAVEPLKSLLRRDCDEYMNRLEMAAPSQSVFTELYEVGLADDWFDELARLAAYALGKIGEPEAVDALLEALSDPDEELRRLAAEALGRIGDEGAVDALIEALQDRDADVRGQAAEALGDIGSRRALPALQRAASQDDSLSNWEKLSDTAEKAIRKVRKGRRPAKRRTEGVVALASILESTIDSSVASLFKYVAPDTGIKVLENRSIRFTQASSFNDPFELFPTMGSYLRPLITAIELERMKRAHYSRMADAMEELLGEKAYLYGLLSDVESCLQDDRSREVQAMNRAIQDRIGKMDAEERRKAVSKARDYINERFGVLSLAEKADDILMWSHYADNHRGLVLEFDPTNPFFDQRDFEHDPIRCVRKVQYQAGRPARALFDQKYWLRSRQTASKDLLEYMAGLFFLAKSSHWEYEQEWRLILPFSENDVLIPGPSKDTMHLRPFPPRSIRSVTLGSRASEKCRQRVLEILREPDYAHVLPRRAHLDPQQFRILIKDDESALEGRLLKDIRDFPDDGIQQRINRLQASTPRFYEAIDALSARGLISTPAFDRSKQKKRMLKITAQGRSFLDQTAG